MKHSRSKRFSRIKNFAKLSKKRLLNLVKKLTRRNKHKKQRGG
jgi:hypothetical protein